MVGIGYPSPAALPPSVHQNRLYERLLNAIVSISSYRFFFSSFLFFFSISDSFLILFIYICIYIYTRRIYIYNFSPACGSHKRVITLQNPCNLSPFIRFETRSANRYMYKNSRPVTKIALSRVSTSLALRRPDILGRLPSSFYLFIILFPCMCMCILFFLNFNFLCNVFHRNCARFPSGEQ